MSVSGLSNRETVRVYIRIIRLIWTGSRSKFNYTVSERISLMADKKVGYGKRWEIPSENTTKM